jgi:hypothetical protein
MAKFVSMGLNEVLACDGFSISYVRQLTPDEINPLDYLLNTMGALDRDNLGRPETAICIPDEAEITGMRHYILYGDYREQYAAVADKGLNACVEVFLKNLDHVAQSSNMPDHSTH